MVNNYLLFVGCAAWWLGSTTRRAQALDILLRARFWKRVGIRLLLPALVLFPLAFASEALQWRLLQAARHVGCAGIAAAALADVFRGEVDLADHALQNWLVTPWILLLTSLVILATIFGALIADGVACRSSPLQCSHPGAWPTLSAAATSPAGHFVLAFGTPALILATEASVWILDTAPLIRPRTIVDAASWSPFERRLPWRLPSAPPTARGACRYLGCRSFQVAVALGIAAGQSLQEGPLHNVLHVIVTVPFFLSLWLAVTLCTSSADNSTFFGLLRFVATAAIAKGMLVLLLIFIFSNQYIHNSFGVSQSLYAHSEYAVLTLLALWPLTWMEDARAIRDPGAAVGLVDTLGIRTRLV